MIDCSYTAVYDSYSRFCRMIGQPVLNFESWMIARDNTGTKKDKAKEFLSTENELSYTVARADSSGH